MIATIAKRFTFDAAHRLDRLPPSHKCHRMHGHTYEVELVFQGPVDETTGFVLDYADIAAAWDPLHEQLDHRVLNEVKGLEVPSTENLAAWIATRIAAYVPGQIPSSGTLVQRRIETVRVRESTTTWCEVNIAILANRADVDRFLP